MRHLVVGRIALALSALLVVAATLFAWRADATHGATERATGAASFARHCAACHEAAKLAEPLGNEGDAVGQAAAAARMLEFLKDHAGATVEEDRAIVSHLRSIAVGHPSRAWGSR